MCTLGSFSDVRMHQSIRRIQGLLQRYYINTRLLPFGYLLLVCSTYSGLKPPGRFRLACTDPSPPCDLSLPLQ
jgi:hypothetical protein